MINPIPHCHFRLRLPAQVVDDPTEIIDELVREIESLRPDDASDLLTFVTGLAPRLRTLRDLV